MLFGWRQWIICLPLSCFLFGCSDSKIGVRTSPSTNDRGIRGPNLLQFPSPEVARQFRVELRNVDFEMSKVLEKIIAISNPESDESRALKSEWIALDNKITLARTSQDLVALHPAIHSLLGKIPARQIADNEPEAPKEDPDAPKNETRTLNEVRDEYILILAEKSAESRKLEKLVGKIKPVAERLSNGELEAWGEASQYIENFDVRYLTSRSAIRMANDYEALAQAAKQMKIVSNTTPELMIKALGAIKVENQPGPEALPK